MHEKSFAPPRGGSTLPVRISIALLSTIALLSSGCDQGDNGRPEENAEAGAWRTDIRSEDPAVRARAADLVLGAPGDDGLEALADLATSDPDPRVREQAVLSYAQLGGKDAVTLLKDVALGDESEAVTSAALAGLDKIKTEADEPVRAWMDVKFPQTFAAGQPFEVKVRFGSKESAPKAMLQLKLPEGFEVSGPKRSFWKGEVVAGQAQEVVFRVVPPTRVVQSGARVRLQVDYPEQLDLDQLHENVRVAIDEQGSGRFEAQPAPIRRSP